MIMNAVSLTSLAMCNAATLAQSTTKNSLREDVIGPK
jgi:hypothetical protein